MVPALHVIREGRSREYLGQRMGLVFGECTCCVYL